MESDNHHPVRLPEHVRVETMEGNPYVGTNPQDIAALGALMTANGFSALQARALVAKVQQVAAQVSLAMSGEILEEVRNIQEARLHEIINKVYILPTAFGMGQYIRRDMVVRLLQEAVARVPRQ